MALSLWFRIASFCGWLLGATLLLALANANIPIFKNIGTFWYRVALLEAFSALIWLAGVVYLTISFGGGRRGYGGIAPSLALTIGIYGALSVGALLCDLLLSARAGLTPVFWLIELGRTVLAAVVILCLEIARLGAVVGLPNGEGGASPGDLCGFLMREERRFELAGDVEVGSSFRTLRETIRASLNDNVMLRQPVAYKKLAHEVIALCSGSPDELEKSFNELRAGAARQLTTEVRYLASNGVRRR
jgi:hypothetical protein